MLRINKCLLILSSIACTYLLLIASAQAAGNEYIFDGHKISGGIKEYGCRKHQGGDPLFVATLNGDTIEGSMKSAGPRDNEIGMALVPQHFSLAIRDDGTFGSDHGDGPSRLWLRWWASKSSGYGSNTSKSAADYSGRKGKYQWVKAHF